MVMSRKASRFAAVAIVVSAVPLNAQSLRRISLTEQGGQANNPSGVADSAFTRDGRSLVFATAATNLVPGGDTNNGDDVLLADLITGQLELINVNWRGAQSDGSSDWPAMTPDGRYVVFHSSATRLVQNDNNQHIDVFLRDRQLGKTILVSRKDAATQSDGDSFIPAISADGRFVAFTTWADNLFPNDNNSTTDVCVVDMNGRTVVPVSVDSNGVLGDDYSSAPKLSGDGRIVAFNSLADNLVAGDGNQAYDVFTHDLKTGTTARVSLGIGGVDARGSSELYGLTPDARWCLFTSGAPNLVTGDRNQAFDVFVCDLATGAIMRMDVDAQGNEADRGSGTASISADGRFVAFTSLATNLLGAGNPLSGTHFELFLHDRDLDGNGIFDEAGGIDTRLLSVDVNSGGESDDDSNGIAMSGDGLRVAFDSRADDLVASDTNYASDVFLVNDGAAARVTYGSGWAGTLGAPALTASADPILGTTISIDATDSLGAATAGVLVLGGYAVDDPTGLGGSLLAAPELILPISIPATGFSQPGTLPIDPVWSGIELFLQVLELDAGASQGVSFTPGLELILG
jgi:Tol biopolymer transport system component